MSNEEPKFAVEEVAEVNAPRRARVDDIPEPAAETPAEKLERKRDYLEGFLAAKPEAVSPAEPGGDIYEGVIAALKEIFDPEIPVAESMPGEVELRVSSVPGVRDAEVNLVWDPAWDPAKMSDEAKLELGML